MNNEEEKLEFTYGVYDVDVCNKLWEKSDNWTEEERQYCIFCYHYEEWRAGML